MLTAAAAAHETTEFCATLTGFEEVGALNNQSEAILSEGREALELKMDRRNGLLDNLVSLDDGARVAYDPLLMTVLSLCVLQERFKPAA